MMNSDQSSQHGVRTLCCFCFEEYWQIILMKIAGKYVKVLEELADRKFPGRKEVLLQKTRKNYDRFMSEIPDID